jgi:hypothetical protein
MWALGIVREQQTKKFHGVVPLLGMEDGPSGKGEGCRNVVVVDDEMEAPSPNRPYSTITVE